MTPLIALWPHFDAVAFQIGFIKIHWYALGYIVGLLIGWAMMRKLVQMPPFVMPPAKVDDFLAWATFGVVIGGRAGYILFYRPHYYFSHPEMIYRVWDGGMSFHGGIIGVTVAVLLFSRRHKINFWALADRVAVPAPIGLALGRMGNFINGELWGRPAPHWFPFQMIYPQAGFIPRYPSELFELFLEGIVLFTLLFILSCSDKIREKCGFLAGTFILGYGFARTTAEFFRQPDPFYGYLWGGLTMGQLLSVPMIFIGGFIMWKALTRPNEHLLQAEPAEYSPKSRQE